MTDIKSFITKDGENKITEAIQRAEATTSGEIRVHLENYCSDNVLERAAQIFTKLKMHETDLRNGVLIYVAVRDQKFAIIGDEGIDKVVPDHFWEKVRDAMQNHFQHHDYITGLVEGIDSAANQLKQYFPKGKDNQNELPDDISFKDN